MPVITQYRILLLSILIQILVESTQCFSQNFEVKGRMLDASNKEPLLYGNIMVLPSKKVFTTNELGEFKITVNSLDDSVLFTFVGYANKMTTVVDLIENFDVLMNAQMTTLKSVEIRASKSVVMEQFENIRTGKQVLKKEALMQLPALAGEPDFLKALTLLPGATKGVEGTNDFFIRGGDADQNLILLDGATVYNTGHLFGFLSVFNPSAIGEVSMMTGGFPAEYGGRLSSIIDIKSKQLEADRTFIEGGVGLISSRAAIEFPIVKNKVAMQIAGRRTYADQVVKLANLSLPYYFYDVNANLDWKISDKSRLHYGFYLGDDVLDFSRDRDESVPGNSAGSSFNLGNIIHHVGYDFRSERLTSQSKIHFTVFDYNINSYFQDNFLNVVSDIQDIGLSQKFTVPVKNNQLHFGFYAIHRQVNPNLINSGGELSELIPSSTGKSREVIESAVFAEWEFEQGNMKGILGSRISAAIVENTEYWQPEPRIALRYSLPNHYTIKASYTRMAQYIHRVSSSSFALPTDIWYPINDRVKPQSANQITLGINKLLKETEATLSAEFYYKTMTNLMEFREGTNLILNNDFEEALIQGSGNSYGFEWLARKDAGKFKGWLSYTLSWTNRQFDELNNGETFAARYDRRHNVSVVTNYALNSRWSFSAVWEFISGARFTPVIGYYAVPNSATTGVDLIPVFPERNSVKLADTHRLDLSVTLKSKIKPHKRWQGEWQFSIYNAYNRATPVAINITYDEEQNTYQYEQPGLLGLLPSISYNFKFYK